MTDRQDIVDIAASLLLEQRLSSLKLDITQLKYTGFSIAFDSMENFSIKTRVTRAQLMSCEDLKDGCTIIRDTPDGRHYLILFNEQVRNAGRRAFTLAHEIGHVYLGHSDDSSENERQANLFAAELLIPRVLAYEYLQRASFNLTPVDLCAVFSASPKAAENALSLLKSRAPLKFSDKEQQVLRRFGGLLPYPDEPVIDF